MINNKMKVYFTLVLCTLLVGLLVLFNSYAYWRVSGNQSKDNTILGTCLNIDIEEETDGNNVIDGISLSNAYPISDEEGANQTGYTFTIVNNCKVDTKYEVVLESLKINGFSNEDYLKDEYYKIQIDDGMIRRYSQLDEVDNSDPNNIKEIRYVFSGTIPAKQGDEPTKESHTIKFWIASDATTNDAQNKQFKSRVNVIAGQNIVTAPDYKVADARCFYYIENGYINHYYYDICGTNVIIPAHLNGMLIEKLEQNQSNPAFLDRGEQLTSLDISGLYGVKEIPKDSFKNYIGLGTTLTIPSNVETISNSAFYNFNGDKIVFPQTLKTISHSAFIYFEGDELEFPSHLEVIDVSAFLRYNGADITIPSTVNKIGLVAFGSMDSSKNIYVNKPNLDGMELGRDWNGNAKVKCLVSENTYGDCPSS